MPDYVAFLRAVNIGKRQLKMADLRACLSASGLEDVETYIQTGNVRFTAPLESREEVAEHVERVLRAGCGFDVPTVVLTPEDLRAVYDDAVAMPQPFPDVLRRYVMFLRDEPTADAVAAVDGWSPPGESARVVRQVVHVWLAMSSHAAKFSNARFEKLLGVPGTTRDLNVVTTLAERWGR